MYVKEGRVIHPAPIHLDIARLTHAPTPLKAPASAAAPQAPLACASTAPNKSPTVLTGLPLIATSTPALLHSSINSSTPAPVQSISTFSGNLPAMSINLSEGKRLLLTARMRSTRGTPL